MKLWVAILPQLLGKSKALSEVLHNIRLVAPTDSTVLIGGESGTGKELVAAPFTTAAHDTNVL